MPSNFLVSEKHSLNSELGVGQPKFCRFKRHYQKEPSGLLLKINQQGQLVLVRYLMSKYVDEASLKFKQLYWSKDVAENQ